MVVWKYVVEFLGFEIGIDYISITSKWLQKEKYYVGNIITSVVLRGIWLTRNDVVVFQRLFRCQTSAKKNLG
jgi:hypothetical protein